jgi:hypothetical protein
MCERTPVIGQEGLLRLVEWAGHLQACGPGGGNAASIIDLM